MHRWFLVDNVNVEVKCVDLDSSALVGAVWATRAVWSVSTQLGQEVSKTFQYRTKTGDFCCDSRFKDEKTPIDRELLKDY